MNCLSGAEERLCRPNHTVPYGTGLVLHFTRHFVPGYLHLVPSSFVVLNYGGQVGTKGTLHLSAKIDAA